MRVYLTITLNHFRALTRWALEKNARLTLDATTFELEVRYRNRYYVLRPMFLARPNGRLHLQTELPDEDTGFGGWRPYHTLMHPLSTRKTAFRDAMQREGIVVPRALPPTDAFEDVPFDYLLKGEIGSFGQQVYGPFKANTAARGNDDRPRVPGPVFVEEFVRGRILKVWFWGSRAFFAHAHDYPTVAGDGSATLDDLVRAKLSSIPADWDTHPDRHVITTCLRFQNLELSDVLPAGKEAWIDFRYSYRYTRFLGATPATDNALPDLLAVVGDQISQMGNTLVRLTREAFPAPVMLTADAQLTDSGVIHWLEMNTNSIMPPEGYDVMFADLFG
jgi:hypothetical protein